jgi:hypothetical protein
MGRNREKPPAGPDEPAKYSFLVPAELDRKIMEICRLRGLRSQSVVLREILAQNVDRYLSAAGGVPPCGETAPAGPGLTRLPIDLTEPVRRALDRAARDLNLSPAALVQMVVAEQLPQILQRAGEQLEKLRRLLDGDTKESAGGG